MWGKVLVVAGLGLAALTALLMDFGELAFIAATLGVIGFFGILVFSRSGKVRNTNDEECP
jgi:hypothetical protein